MKKYLITSAVAISMLASIATVAGAAFMRNLTVGSTGTDVAELQTFLISKGYTIPAISSGAATPGYFGSQTKTAVMAYQAAKGLPSTGFFGPLTRASVEAMMAGTPIVVVPGAMVCPVGYTCTANPGTPVTPVTPGSTVISTPGVEGTLSVTQTNAGINTTVYEGQSMVPVLGFKIEAKNSDILVQRVKLDLGASTKIFNKIYSKIYVVDGSNVLSSSDLNSTTVVKDGSNYFITLAGFSSIVKKDATKTLLIKVDVRSSIDSTDLSSNYTIAFPSTQGIRGVDGAGIDQYAGTSAITKTINVDSSLTESATLAVSTNSNTPKTNDVVAAEDSTEDGYSELTVLNVDFKAEKDDVKITDLAVDITKSGSGGATASTTVYLYDGSTQLDTASYSSGTATFSDIDLVVSRDTTKTLTIKVDVTGANGTVSQIAADIDTADVTAENMAGDSITESGSATGESMYVRNVGPIFTLTSKSITKSQTAAQNNLSTSTADATFTVTVKAVGGDIHFGTTASGTPMFGSTPTYFQLYKDGVATNLSVASSTSFDVPSSGVVTTGLTNSFVLQENNTISIPVTFRVEGKTLVGALVTGGSYSVGLQGISWNGANISSFMSGKTDWRTSTVSLP